MTAPPQCAAGNFRVTPTGGYSAWRYAILQAHGYADADIERCMNALDRDTELQTRLVDARQRGVDENTLSAVVMRSLLDARTCGRGQTACFLEGHIAAKLLFDYFRWGQSVRAAGYETHLLSILKATDDAKTIYSDRKTLEAVMCEPLTDGGVPAYGVALLRYVLPLFFAALPDETDKLLVASLLAHRHNAWQVAKYETALRCRPSLFVVYCDATSFAHDVTAKMVHRHAPAVAYPSDAHPCVAASFEMHSCVFHSYYGEQHMKEHGCDGVTCSWWSAYITHSNMLMFTRSAECDCKACPRDGDNTECV